ncbi:MAG: two-component system phosphate regulon response regulator PhoB [Bacteriovoracaceae bacterium]|jgi:two-component system phosphate regulon response regulator PhoB
MDPSKIKILIAEDEEDIRELIHFNLFKEKFIVETAANGAEALEKAKAIKPDLMLLDIMMPEMDGLEVCRNIRSDKSFDNTGIVMLTAKGDEEDIIKGLELGADDYIIKPFSPKVVIARVKAVLRRRKVEPPKEEEVFEIYGIKIDSTKRRVFLDEVEVSLTFTEFQILSLLSMKAGWVFTRSQIVDTIRGDNHAVTDRSVDVQIVGLRKKLGIKGDLIETVRGVGYRFKETSS